MATIVDGSTIVLSGTVGGGGDYFWFEDGFGASDVILALAQIGHDRDVEIRLNSGGGIATEGAAIHAAIVRHAGRKTVVVEGVAASAASVIAMAGDEIVMSPGSIMMIHDPSGYTIGTVADHEQQVKALTALGDSMAGIYAARSGKETAAARAEMIAELWLTPEQAVAEGYADRVAGAEGEMTGEVIQFPEPAAFAYQAYQHAPDRLVAMANAKGWGTPPKARAALPAQPRQKETPMATETTGGGNADPNTNVVTLDAARAEGRTGALAYVREVQELCAIAGQHAKATGFIDANAAVADVRASLLEARASADATATITNHQAPAAGAPSQAAKGSLAASMRRMVGVKEG